MISPRRILMSFDDMTHNLQRKLGNWNGSNLSQAGRITLINSVPNATPAHAVNVTWLPNRIMDHMEKKLLEISFGKNVIDPRVGILFPRILILNPNMRWDLASMICMPLVLFYRSKGLLCAWINKTICMLKLLLLRMDNYLLGNNLALWKLAGAVGCSLRLCIIGILVSRISLGMVFLLSFSVIDGVLKFWFLWNLCFCFLIWMLIWIIYMFRPCFIMVNGIMTVL